MPRISKKRTQKKYKPNKSKKRIVLKGGVPRHTTGELQFANGPTWRQRFNGDSFTTVVKVRDRYLYGTSIPFWNPADMQDIMKFYLMRKNINRIISFHACNTLEGMAHHHDCSQYPNLEDQTFNDIKNASGYTQNNHDVQFINIFIQDMTPGSIDAWGALTQYRFTSEREKTIIHCLAGFGRTGTALLFFALYYKGNIDNILLKQFFGTNTSVEMYHFIVNIMVQEILIDDNPDNENDPYNNRIQVFDPGYQILETTNYADNYHANLLISRINYCILFFAFQHKVNVGTPIYLYILMDPSINPSSATIFTPYQVFYDPILFNQADINGLFVVSN